MIKTDALNYKKKILIIALLFVVSYAISLLIWSWIKDVYGLGIFKLSANFITYIHDVSLKSVGKTGEILKAVFILKPFSFKDTVQTTFTIPISTFTYNSPLTFAIIFSFIPFIARKRHLAEAFIILFIIHLIFLFLFFGEKITIALVELGVLKSDSVKVFIWEFIWGFWDNLVMRFEPFLVGAYLFFSTQNHRISEQKQEIGKNQKVKTRKRRRKKNKL